VQCRLLCPFPRILQQEAIPPGVGVAAFDDFVGHAAGLGHLFGEGFFGEDDGGFDLVVAFDFDDDVASVVFLDEEVGVVAANGVGVGVYVLDVEFALAVGEHAGEVEFGDAPVAQEVPEEVALRGGVEAVGVEVEALGGLDRVYDGGGVDDHFFCGGDFVVAFGRGFDEVYFVVFGLFVGGDGVAEFEEARDDDVVEKLVEAVDVLQDTVRAFGGLGQEGFDFEAGEVQVAGDLGVEGEGAVLDLRPVFGEVVGDDVLAIGRAGGKAVVDGADDVVALGIGCVQAERCAGGDGAFGDFVAAADAGEFDLFDGLFDFDAAGF